MSFNNILGQERAKKILENSMVRGTISHAYLFAGPEGMGKRFTAFNFAKALNCYTNVGDSCDNCLSCRKIDSLNHPDVGLIKPEASSERSESRGSIKIGAIRELQKRLSLKPYEGKKKVVILDAAEDMTTGAANAFLKTLEEPPGETVIIMITSNLNSLLPTVASRCQIIRFNTLSNEHITEILIKNYGFRREHASIVSSLSKGRLGLAVTMDYKAVCKLRSEALKLIINSMKGDIEYIFSESKRLARKGEMLPEFLDFIIDLLRDALLIHETETNDYIIHKDIYDELRGFSLKLKRQFIIDMFDTVYRTQTLLKRNVNQQLALDSMMMSMVGDYR